MANGRFRDYYWHIRTLISENDDIVRLETSSSDDYADYANILDFRLVFRDGSRFIATANLRSNHHVIEHNYYYGYRDSSDIRIFSYDDRDHHPNIETHPHHRHVGPDSENDTPLPSDLDPVNFFTVFQKIRDEFFT